MHHHKALELLTCGSHPLMPMKPTPSSLVPEDRAQGRHFSFPCRRLHGVPRCWCHINTPWDGLHTDKCELHGHAHTEAGP